MFMDYISPRPYIGYRPYYSNLLFSRGNSLQHLQGSMKRSCCNAPCVIDNCCTIYPFHYLQLLIERLERSEVDRNIGKPHADLVNCSNGRESIVYLMLSETWNEHSVFFFLMF